MVSHNYIDVFEKFQAGIELKQRSMDTANSKIKASAWVPNRCPAVDGMEFVDFSDSGRRIRMCKNGQVWHCLEHI